MKDIVQEIVDTMLGPESDHFVTTKLSADILDSPSPTYDASASVTWSVDFDYRSWGVKDILVSVHKVVVDFTSEVDDMPKSVEFPMEGWTIETTPVGANGSIFPRNVEVNFKLKKVTVGFHDWTSY